MIFKPITDETTLSGQRIVGALQARKIAQEQAIKQTNIDIQCLRNYENACKNGTVSSDDFTRIMDKASTQAQAYSKNIKEGTGSAQIYADKQKALQHSIKNTGIASKVAAVGVKTLSVAGNMLASMAITFVFSKIIEGINYLATASKRAIEKTKELQQEISQISSDYQSERQTLEGLRKEYDALTSKIGENGAEASLSADEYERYRDITSEILGITPKLITGWDEEGRAISNKNGLLQQSIDLLNEEYQKSLRNSTTKSKNEEIATGIIEQKRDFDNSGDTKTVSGTKYDLVWKDLENYINEAVANKKISYTYESTGIVGTNDSDAAYAINKFVYGDSLYEATKLNTAYGWLGSLQERITSSQENFEKFANSLTNEDNPIYQWFTDEQINVLIRDADEYFQELARIEGEEQQYFQQYKDQLNLNAQAVGDAYSDLDEQTKAGITQMIDSFDYNDMTKEKFSDMATDLKDFIGKLSTDDILLSYFNNLFKPMGEDESIEDYELRVKTGLDEITSYCKSNYPAINLNLGDIEKDVEDLKLKYNTAISKFTGGANDVDLGQFFRDNSINDEYEINYWNKVTEGAKTASEAVEMYNNVKGDTFNDEITGLLGISQTVDQLNTQLKPAMDSLKSAWQDIFTDNGFALNGIDILSTCDSIKSKLDELNKVKGITVDYSAYENFVRVLRNTESTEQDVEDAFDSLATSITNAGLTGTEDFETMKAALSDLGVVNSELVAFEALINNTEALKKAGLDLSSADDELLTSFVNERIAAENCGQALALLQLKKALCRETALTPGSDINSLYQLAKAAGIATEQIGMLAGLNAAYEKESAAGHTQAALAIAGRMAKVKADVEKQFAEIGNVEVDFSAKVNKGASSAAAKQEETDYKNLLDAETNLLEQQLAANIITFQEYTDRQKQIIDDYYRDGKIKAQDYYDALADMYAGQLSHRDKAIRAVEGTIDREISRLKEQKEAIENSYQVKIDAIQSEIDALNKANDARKTQIDLEKAQYEVERAKNQRVNKVFDGSQFVYSADEDAIRDAEDTLADRKLQSDISIFEGQITSLKTEMENATKSLDIQIGALEAYKGKWNEISGVYEEQQNRLIAAEILGADWETQILDGRLGVLQSFTEHYIALQQAQADAAVNAARIKAEADAGNPEGGNVGSAPDTQILGGTETKLPPPGSSQKQSSSGTNGPHYNLKMQKFHDGLDEGYAGNAPSGSQNLKILQSAAQKLHLNADEVPAVLRTGELVLTPEQQQNIVRNARMAFLRSNGINPETDEYGAISHIQSNPQNVYNNISINCPNVTNSTGAEYILKSLQRLPLDTIQYTHRRQK